MGAGPKPGGPPSGPLALAPWLQIVLFLPLLVLYGWQIFKSYRAGTLTKKKRGDLWILVTLQFGGFLAVFNEARLPGMWRYLLAVAGLYFTQAFAAVTVFVLGWFAYVFKRRNKLYYGYLEVFFGMLSAVMVVRSVNFAAIGLAQGVAVVASAYVVARGLTDCYEAKHPTTPAG